MSKNVGGIMRQLYKYCAIILGITCASLLSSSFGDVIILKSGERKEGIVEDVPSEPENIMFINSTGGVKISRDRLQGIEKEEPYVGHLKIGNQHLAAANFQRALEEYEKALKLHPGDPEIEGRIALAKSEIAKQQAEEQKLRIERIGEMMSEAGQLVAKEQYEEAEALLKRAEKMGPTSEQTKEINRTLADLYYRWGLYQEDRLNREEAGVLYQQALALEPNNAKAYDRLVGLWEDDPTKLDEVISVYERKIEMSPNDPVVLLKLADAYYRKKDLESALPYYLQVYKLGNYRGTYLPERLASILQRLSQDYAGQRNFEKAAYYYQLYLDTFPNVDPTPLYIYQYAERSLKLAPDDYDGRVELAKFCREKGLDNFAKKELNRVLIDDPDNKKALEVLNQYAQEDLNEALFFYNDKQYEVAVKMGRNIIDEYPKSSKVIEQASELISKAENDLAREQRLAKQDARQLAQRGNEYFSRAEGYISAMYSTDRLRSVHIVSEKGEAIKYLRRAITAWENALQLDPSLAAMDTEDLANKLRDAKARLYALENPVPLRLPPTRQRSW
jgi:tetratricopeptide (TPR) repeat protein